MDQGVNSNDIEVAELKIRIQKGEILNIVDVREVYEYEESNLGAILIPLGDLKERLSEIRHLADQEIIIHCRTGNRSAAAKYFLLQNGFKMVRSLLGGISAYNENVQIQ